MQRRGPGFGGPARHPERRAAREVRRPVYQIERQGGVEAGADDPAADREPERGALTRLALHPHPSLQSLGEAVADREAQAGAAIQPAGRGVRLAERAEQAIHTIGGDADAGIAHGETEVHELASRELRRRRETGLDQDEDLSLGGELDRVVQEIDQDLAQPRGVALDHGRHGGIDLAADLQPLAHRLGSQQIDRLLHASAEGERRRFDDQLAGLDFREIQNVVQQSEQRLAAAADRAHVFALLGGQPGAGEDAGHANDGVHRRADLMAHVGQELALEPVGALRLFLGRARLFLRPRELLDGRGEAPGSLAGFGFGASEALGALADEALQPPGEPL